MQALGADQRVRAAVEDNAFGNAAMIEIGGDPGLDQLVQNVLCVGPVFQSLKVVVEPVADISVPFMHRDPAIGLGKNDRSDQTGRTGRNTLAF
jgi:hypothetical protein